MTKVKLLIQQCLSARLKLPNDDGSLEIGRGQVAFVCFLKEADEDSASKAADLVSTVKFSEDYSSSKRVSISELHGDVLIIPQATLGGKFKKGKGIQYHDLIDKTTGEKLYGIFCEAVKKNIIKGRVKSGIYGARQILSMDTNGPYTHILEL